MERSSRDGSFVSVCCGSNAGVTSSRSVDGKLNPFAIELPGHELSISPESDGPVHPDTDAFSSLVCSSVSVRELFSLRSETLSGVELSEDLEQIDS